MAANWARVIYALGRKVPSWKPVMMPALVSVEIALLAQKSSETSVKSLVSWKKMVREVSSSSR